MKTTKDTKIKLNEQKIREDLKKAGITLEAMSLKMGHSRSYINQRLAKGTMTKQEHGRMYGLLSQLTNINIPTPRMVEEYGKEIGFIVDGKYFCDYYNDRGWKIKNKKILDWKACVRTWKKNAEQWRANQKNDVDDRVSQLEADSAIILAKLNTIEDILEKHNDMSDNLNMRLASIEIDYDEKKDRRAQIVLKPSIYQMAKEEADREGISFNEFINRAVIAKINEREIVNKFRGLARIIHK